MIGVQERDYRAPRRPSIRALALLIGLVAAIVSQAAVNARAATAPSVEDFYVETAGITTATLKAYIAPGEAETSYRFEYGTDTSYGASAPVPDGTIPPDATSLFNKSLQNVGEAIATVSGLQPNTTYHYRVVASNQDGTVASADQTFTTFGEPESRPDACPNAAYRIGGLSESLPDCRAYEMVSPIDKNGGDVLAAEKAIVASESGAKVSFEAHSGFADTSGSGGTGVTQYVASRSDGGWVTHSVTPTPAVVATQVAFAGLTYVEVFSGELDHGMIEAYDLPEVENDVPHESNLYLENTSTNSLEAITRNETAEQPPFRSLWGTYRGSSNDLGVVTFESRADLLPNLTEGNPKLYVWEHGTLKLGGILPGGSIPAGGSSAGREYLSPKSTHESAEYDDTVSRNGSRFVFLSPADGSAPPQLYLRKAGTSTVRISESEASSPNPAPQNVQFQAATPDMSKVVFSSSDRLLDSDPGGGGYGLYLYTDTPNPKNESNLTFIARVASYIEGGHRLVYGMSEDGSHIYYVSDGGGTREVYLWDSGLVSQVATSISEPTEPPRLSANGGRFAFVGGDGQQYLYDESKGAICVSCPRSGARPTSSVEQQPSGTGGVGRLGTFPQHYLSRDGRYLFFSTATALVPQDTNKLPDAYEYDADTGRVSLLSTGTGEAPSFFVDASASGNDAFIVTRGSLSRWDTDSLVDLYDARVGGGLPEPPQPAAPCAGDECQGVPSAAPTFSTASGFRGLGNPTPSRTIAAKHKARAKHRPPRRSRCRKGPKRRRAKCKAKARRKSRAQRPVKSAGR